MMNIVLVRTEYTDWSTINSCFLFFHRMFIPFFLFCTCVIMCIIFPPCTVLCIQAVVYAFQLIYMSIDKVCV